MAGRQDGVRSDRRLAGVALTVLALVAVLLTPAASQADPVATALPDVPRLVPVTDIDLDEVLLPGDLDHALVDVSRRVAGFGGAYVRGDALVGDTETLVVWLRPGSGHLEQVRAMLVERLGERFDQQLVEVLDANHSFEDLKLWQTALTSSLPGDLLVFTDVDERQNRVVVGVPRGDLADTVRQVAAALAIPDGAVVVEDADPVVPALRSQRRPLRGGLQIQFQSGAFGLSTGMCTLGYPAVRGSVAGFVTNSHCSRTQGEVDNGRYWQATRPLTDGNQVGTETVDPAYTARAGCPAGKLCRRSDANFVRAHNAADVVRGRIARIGTSSTSWNGTNLWRVTSTPSTSLDIVATKVGRTTGLTSGFVRRTCVTFPQAGSDLAILCDHLAELRSDGGDSGSPVFRVTNSPNTNDVAGLGVLWGTTTFNGQPASVFSPIADVRTEVGGSGINVCASGFSC